MEDTPDYAGTGLLCSRRQAWSDLMLRQAVECTRRMESNRIRTQALEAKLYGSVAGGGAGQPEYPAQAHKLEAQVSLLLGGGQEQVEQ